MANENTATVDAKTCVFRHKERKEQRLHQIHLLAPDMSAVLTSPSPTHVGNEMAHGEFLKAERQSSGIPLLFERDILFRGVRMFMNAIYRISF